jgi:hypothetical protein
MKRAAVVILLVIVALHVAAFAKPKRKEFNNTPKEVFDAALRTARERHVVTYVDEPHLMFAFETGMSMLAYGFNANASVEPEGGGKSVLIINVQHKNTGQNPGFSFNAGDRMADKFYSQVAEELARTPTQKVAEKPEAQQVPVPAGTAMNSQPQQPPLQQPEQGVVTITSNPDGADVTVDGGFVGNAPATLKLKPGTHNISVQQAGYAPWSRDLTVMEGASTKLNATLSKQ